MGIEPLLCSFGMLKFYQIELPPRGIYGRDYTIRTCDPLVPNQVLYQAELRPVTYYEDSKKKPYTQGFSNVMLWSG